MKRPRKTVSLLATAHHEAGDAVISDLFGIPVKRLTVIPKDSSLGSCRTDPSLSEQMLEQIEWNITPLMEKKMEFEMLSIIAGREAQKKFSPTSVRSYHSASDDQILVDLALRLAAPGNEVNTLIKYLTVKGRRLVAQHWNLITFIATHVAEAKTLSGAAFRRLRAQWYIKEDPGTKHRIGGVKAK